MKIALIVIAVLVVAGLAAGGQFVSVRNALVPQREAVNTAFKDIAGARAALINGRSPQEKFQANDQLSGALSRLLVISENYPQLRSNENFLRLQDEIDGTENRIAVERRKYNETLQRYNTSIQVFPNNIVAGMAGFGRNDAYFRTEPGA